MNVIQCYSFIHSLALLSSSSRAEYVFVCVYYIIIGEDRMDVDVDVDVDVRMCAIQQCNCVVIWCKKF